MLKNDIFLGGGAWNVFALEMMLGVELVLQSDSTKSAARISVWKEFLYLLDR